MTPPLAIQPSIASACDTALNADTVAHDSPVNIGAGPERTARHVANHSYVCERLSDHLCAKTLFASHG